LYSGFLLGTFLVTLLSTRAEEVVHEHGEDGGTVSEVYQISYTAQYWLALCVSWPGMLIATALLNWSYHPEFKRQMSRRIIRYLMVVMFVSMIGLTAWKLFTLSVAALQRGSKIWLEAVISEHLVELIFHSVSYFLCVRCCCPCWAHCHYWFFENCCACFLYTMNKEAYLNVSHAIDTQRKKKEPKFTLVPLKQTSTNLSNDDEMNSSDHDLNEMDEISLYSSGSTTTTENNNDYLGSTTTSTTTTTENNNGYPGSITTSTSTSTSNPYPGI